MEKIKIIITRVSNGYLVNISDFKIPQQTEEYVFQDYDNLLKFISEKLNK